MKKFWEKHSLGKTLAIILGLALLFTWIIPVGSFNGTEFVKGDYVRLGLADLGNMLYYVVAIALDKIILLLAIGVFYGILTKVPAYKKLVNKIANKMKGKEIVFACIISCVIALFTSFAANVYAVLVFIPFIINILAAMKYDKLSTLAITFGSIFVGMLGCMFGTEGLSAFNQYLSQGVVANFIKDGWVVRMIIFIITFAIFTVFNILHMKGALKNKKAEVVADPFVVEDTKDKVAIWPIIVILVFVSLITIIGFINWFDNFGIEVFNNFHAWLTGLTISKTPIFSYILGSSAVALGNSGFSLFTLTSVLIVFSVILLIMGGFKFDDALASVTEGAKKMGKVVLPFVVVYTIFAIFYLSPMMNTMVSKFMKADTTPNVNIDYRGSNIAYFNIDTNEDGKPDKNLVGTASTCKINCDTNKDGFPDKNLDFDGNGKIDENDKVIASTFTGQSVINLDTNGDGIPDINVANNVSIPGTIVTGLVSSIFHPDFNYTAYSLSQYLISGFASNLSLIFLILITMFGFAAIFIPTSALLVVGLSYTDVEYKDWLKYICRFLACTFVFLIIVYLFI